MKTAVMALAGFALLPFALPAILVSVVIVAAFIYWAAPLLWCIAVIVGGVKLWRWFGKETHDGSTLGMVAVGDNSVGVVQRSVRDGDDSIRQGT